jgi:hypothetical protein
MRRDFIDDPTGIENGSKQEALDLIRFNLINMLEGGDQFTRVDNIVHGINLRDIDSYMRFLSTEKALSPKLKNLKIEPFDVRDLDLFSKLCEYNGVYNTDIPRNWDQRIYFIESSDFAMTFIPIELGDRKVINIYMEPLEESPDFITELWAELNDEKGLDDIDFVDAKDLM